MTQEEETREPQSKIAREEPDDFRESLRKTLLLKQFAVRNGYKVPAQLLSQISALELSALDEEGEATLPGKPKGLASASAKLDSALTSLTSITFPITADNLLEGDPEEYVSFKKLLLWIGLLALCFAVIGLAVATKVGWNKEVGCSILAISLGTLGAVVYCFFDALGVVPAQTFSRKDKYPLYARLELGVLLGWVFYFGFARQAFNDLGAGSNSTKSQAFYLMIPFIAGYSTKFVVGVLERIMTALLVALGIEGKREARIKRTREAASDGPSS